MNNDFTKEEKKAFLFGLFSVLIFSIFFLIMAFSQYEYKHLNDNFYHLKATFRRTDGLIVGDIVRMAGVDVGRVVEASLDDHFHAVLTFEIDEDLKIPDDSSASIVSSGIMGGKYIEIEPGGSDVFLQPNQEFEFTQDAMILQELLDRIVSIGKSKKKNEQKYVKEEDDE